MLNRRAERDSARRIIQCDATNRPRDRECDDARAVLRSTTNRWRKQRTVGVGEWAVGQHSDSVRIKKFGEPHRLRTPTFTGTSPP
jgi:hypothetical protein